MKVQKHTIETLKKIKNVSSSVSVVHYFCPSPPRWLQPWDSHMHEILANDHIFCAPIRLYGTMTPVSAYYNVSKNPPRTFKSYWTAATELPPWPFGLVFTYRKLLQLMTVYSSPELVPTDWAYYHELRTAQRRIQRLSAVWTELLPYILDTRQQTSADDIFG